MAGEKMIECNNNTAFPKIACILDDFSYTCFKYEANFIQLDAVNWENTLISEKPDLLFIESAWNQNFNKLFREKSNGANSSISVVNWCKKHNIPTVFWNKEDPFHFDHFIEIAKDFDYIFTTDWHCIPQYKAVTEHNRVYLLPFAAQIAIHNPINKDAVKLGKIAFAGTWYARRSIRRKDMEMLLNPALKYGLHIYDRMYNVTLNKNYKFPEIYRPYIKGYLPYEEIVSTYKKYDVFLNVNTVKESPTMVSRRVIELLACGINVVSNDSLAVKKMFPGIVLLCNTEKDAEKHLSILTKDKNLRDRLSLLGQREVFQKHTYTHRMETISKIVGLKYNCRKIPGVSIITIASRQDFMENIIENFQRQKYRNKELIIILNTSSINIKVWMDRIKPYKYIRVYPCKEQKTLGNCINDGVNMARLDYISFFAEDNHYAPDFVGDLMNAFQYSQAEIVGKCTYYTYLKASKVLLIHSPDRENRYVNSLLESAMIVKREIFNKVIFSDTTANVFPTFFEDCQKNGCKIYSADRFNFVNIKQALPQDLVEKCTVVACTDNFETYTVV